MHSIDEVIQALPSLPTVSSGEHMFGGDDSSGTVRPHSPLLISDQSGPRKLVAPRFCVITGVF